MDKVLIFANPIAGRGKGKAIAGVLDKELRRRGFDVEVFLSRSDSLKQVDGEGVRAAIVIGGDGTLRGVAQWAIDRAIRPLEEGSTEPAIPYPLLVVPMGTANLMGKHLGIRWDPEHLPQQVTSALENGRVTMLDAARTADGIFLLMAGVGFDAWVVHELDRLRSGPIDFTSYVAQAIKAMTGYQFPKLTVSVDGKRVFANTPALAMVGNIPEYGTGFPILPLARPDDQLLDVCIMPCESRGQLVSLAMAAATGEHLQREGVVYVKGRSVRIESADKVHVQVDGEPAGTTPVQIDLLHGRVPFIVPR